jgi:hypothetical protein
MHPVVDKNNGNLLDVSLEQRRVIQDRPLDQGDVGKIGEHPGDNLTSGLAEVAVRAAEEGDGGWHVSRLEETPDSNTGTQHAHSDHP